MCLQCTTDRRFSSLIRSRAIPAEYSQTSRLVIPDFRLFMRPKVFIHSSSPPFSLLSLVAPFSRQVRESDQQMATVLDILKSAYMQEVSAPSFSPPSPSFASLPPLFLTDGILIIAVHETQSDCAESLPFASGKSIG